MLLGADPIQAMKKVEVLTQQLQVYFESGQLDEFNRMLDQRRHLLRSLCNEKKAPEGLQEMLHRLHDLEEEWMGEANAKMNECHFELEETTRKKSRLKGLAKAYVPIGSAGRVLYRRG
ncbi:MAG: hypothetical protein EOL87_16510 [Spartobacteria bacterium]|nr:hypothetical protein [Spartobacteria bacterium]